MDIALKGYQVHQLLYDGNRTLVYRGVKEDEGKPVVIKTLHREYPNFNELLQFRHQYALTKNLDIAGIVKPIALEKSGNSYVLIMEDVGGVSLSEYLKCQVSQDKKDVEPAKLVGQIGANSRDRSQNNSRVKEEKKPKKLGVFVPKSQEIFQVLDIFFGVGLSLLKILDNLHEKRIIHKDIKPANILINPETKEIFLIDFSIASLLPRETQTLQSVGQLEGTLAYISPEQTGRMNRGIDYRSDFYSLGVTFYELLTGQLPFESNDAMELVHCHIAKIPTPPHQVNPEIPEVISDIVMKLMAKNAEDRYQSARGIKHDLEVCWQQWQETGFVASFELGQRDLSDRFEIPEKLYGRETEVQALLDAFDRVANPPQDSGAQVEMMLVAGFSGIGKTAVVNEVHKPIVEKRGYFIKGKFDQFQRNIPFSALIQAFGDLMEQLHSESEAQLQRWKTRILHALGSNGQVIIEALPSLEKIIGKQPPPPKVSGNAAQNRFNLLFQKFIKVFATADHPLVIFIDDLQWADAASLKLIQLLTDDSQTGYLLLLGAYRDNEVFLTHPLILTLDEIAKSGTALNAITLEPLTETDLNRLVADTLNCEERLALPLTELIYQKTKGNPFFATQFLKGLHEDGWIKFNSDAGYWQCDMTGVRQLALSDDVVEFMTTRLDKLPEKTREMLKLAACIGNRFDLATLAVASDRSGLEVALCLWRALQEGLVLPVTDTYKFFQGSKKEDAAFAFGFFAGRERSPLTPLKKGGTGSEISVSYKFLHDRIQQAAYSLIPEDRKQKTHLTIGQLLLKNTSEKEREDKLFDIVDRLNIGASLLTAPEERKQLCELNLQAGRKAKSATAYQSSLEYLLSGIELLPENSWEHQYDLTLALYEAATESAYLSGDFQKMEEFAGVTLTKSRQLLDTIAIYEIKIQTLLAQLHFTEAIATAMEVLKKLGIRDFPDNPDDSHIRLGLDEVKRNLGDRHPRTLIDLPAMSDPSKLAAIRLLASISSAAYIAAPMLLPLIIFEQVNLSIKYGNAPASVFAYASQGLVLCGVCNEVELGYQFGELASDLLLQGDKTYAARTLHVINAHVTHCQQHLRATLEGLKEAYSVGIETGELEFAGYAAVYYSFHSYLSGRELSELDRQLFIYSNGLERIKQATCKNYIDIYRQAIDNLLGRSQNPCLLVGEAYNEEEMLAVHQEANDLLALYHLNINRTILCYLFGDGDRAARSLAIAEKYLGGAISTPLIPLFYFYRSLVTLDRIGSEPETTRQEELERIAADLEILHNYASHAQVNYLHKCHLVEAERYRVSDEKLRAIDLYDRAIAGAKENEYIQEQALANELAAKFYLDWNKEKVAAGYMQEAYYCYATWGAKAKIDDLEKRYRQLLAPILSSGEATRLDSRLTISGNTKETISSTTGAVSLLLDLSSAIKASLLISREIKLEYLLEKLMQVVMENAGATKGALILPREQSLMIEAFADCSVGGETIHITSVGSALPLSETEALPISVINSVWRTQKTVLFNGGNPDSKFLRDDYLISSHPQSMVCIPLLNQGKLRGILYLENKLATGAFTSDRLEIIKVLCSQAAVSLENARLYLNLEKSEAREREKSERLVISMQQLQEAQLQLVQSEKMAAIGQLMAGVAHEINNPVGFIAGNLDYALEYLESLTELLALYQQGFNYDSETIQEKIEEIELDFVLEDFPQLILSMKEGTNRIAEISKSMRTFSRADTGVKVPFNLHDGIDSTLLILKHRLKASENRPEIQVVKSYGDLPEVNCYPGQLNQVFMNLIANAIDALDETNSGRSFAEIKSQPNQITITTEIDQEHQNAIVRIGDNGAGMPLEVKKKIFNHLFTTKKVGKGTGLGLSISRQIVVEKHGGTLTCTSEVGKGTEFAIALPLQ